MPPVDKNKFTNETITSLRDAIKKGKTEQIRHLLNRQYEFYMRDEVEALIQRDPKIHENILSMGMGISSYNFYYHKKGMEVLAIRYNKEFREFLELARQHKDPGVYQAFVGELRYADLRGADFSRLNLEGVNFISANLEKAEFIGANLTGARFTAANVRQADFTEAKIEYRSAQTQDITSFEGAYMRRAKITPDLLYKSYYHEAELPNDKDYYVYMSGYVLRDAAVAINKMESYARNRLVLPSEKHSAQLGKVDGKNEGKTSNRTADEQLLIKKREAVSSLVTQLRQKHQEMQQAVNCSNYAEANKARNEFMQILYKPENIELFAKTRNDMSWKRIVGTVALCLTGVGAFVAAADLTHRVLTGRYLLFGETSTSKHVRNIAEAIDPGETFKPKHTDKDFSPPPRSSPKA